MKKSEPAPMTEALLMEWHVGNTYTVVKKLLLAVTKRTGLKFNLSPLEDKVKNELGTFLVYSAGMSGNKRVEFHFNLLKSAEFHSIHLFLNTMAPIAWRRLDLNGFNIVKVFDQVVNFLRGIVGEPLDEAGKVPTFDGLIASLYNSNPAFQQAMIHPNGPDIPFITTELNKEMKKAGGNKQADPAGVPLRVKRFLQGIGQTSRAATVPVATVQPPVKHVVVFTDPTDQEAFDSAMGDYNAMQEMEDFKHDVERICKMDPSINGLIAYGKAGVGKDHWVDKIVEETGVPVAKPSTKAGGKVGFYGFCYDNRDGKVIVFSDYDDIWKNSAEVNLLKIALDDKVVRHLDYGGMEKESPSGQKIPAEGYDFTSKVIFLSNMETLGDDPAFAAHRSRLPVYALLFTDREVLDLIKGALETVTGAGDVRIEMEIKLEVWDFLARMMDIGEPQGAHLTVDFRRFRRALGHRMSCPPDNPTWWKRWALKELR